MVIRVKTALLNDPEIGVMGIEVEALLGVVTLSGRVRSEVQERKAIAIARRTAGVGDVRSRLIVVPERERSDP